MLPVGRVPEVRRWRCGAVPARRHAFEIAWFSCSIRVTEKLCDCSGRPISLDLELAETTASERWDAGCSYSVTIFQMCSASTVDDPATSDLPRSDVLHPCVWRASSGSYQRDTERVQQQ